eukprot:CAMPEP_0182440606 /NCGR_PEP_ID=MMETSP1167-20130531/87173_1 /TAXON_ID=2988 /ORGANISM="Mallomonas Sp, Strain CCMP3275" /LENGTH=319 /DNA_ID=CAMNT_0024634611 /DNA_START=365 /DNA_END=1324 /DNA_ORIENTATION=-
MTKGNQLRLKRDKYGLSSLSFTEYQILERAWDDLFKLGRMVIAYPLSPEFFFYIYVISPILSGSASPWGWKSLPSTFETREDQVKAIDILQKRRFHSILSSLHLLKSEILESHNDDIKEKRENQLKAIHLALKKSELEDSLSELQKFYLSPKKQTDKTGLEFRDIPGSIVKAICNSFAIDGVPNIPLLRQVNKGELSKHLEKVRKSDAYLLANDINSLSRSELQEACFERCISTYKKDDKTLKNNLKQWIRLINNPVISPVGAPLPAVPTSKTSKNKASATTVQSNVNLQNYRLTMMCLHTAKACKTDEYTQMFRDLLV